MTKKSLLLLVGIGIIAIAMPVSLYVYKVTHEPKPVVKTPVTQVSTKTSPAPSDPITPQNLLQWTNDYRIKASIAPLQLSASLNQSAQAKCDDAAVSGDFQHYQNDGATPQTFIDKYYGTGYDTWGENILWQTNTSSAYQTAKYIIDTWYVDTGITDLGHRLNILNTRFQYVGFGICHPIRFPATTYAIQQFVGA